MRLKTLFLPAVLIISSVMVVTFALTAIADVTSGSMKDTPDGRANAPIQKESSSVVEATEIEYVAPSHLWPELRRLLKASGDRLEQPGKERLTLAGILTHAGDPESVPVTLVREFPNRLRLTMQGEARPRVVIFNGHGAARFVRLEETDADLVETFLNDSDEHFFQRQMEGAATRSLGSRFRLDDGTTQDYAGPYYDIYQLSDEVRGRGEARQIVKLYYFNSDTLLLERVEYETVRNGVPVRVTVLLDKWQKVEGQQVPTKIVRTENGTPVATLDISSVSVGSRSDDGLFGAVPR
ncbi:MAG TPA: hypothetical protein VGW12_00300 [Pyrinomonadaceae bacterium]|nr:hypothetical protein [Pyrinomonadaceae bacterium]